MGTQLHFLPDGPQQSISGLQTGAVLSMKVRDKQVVLWWTVQTSSGRTSIFSLPLAPLPPSTLVKKVALIDLTKALELGASKKISIDTDSRKLPLQQSTSIGLYAKREDCSHQRKQTESLGPLLFIYLFIYLFIFLIRYFLYLRFKCYPLS
jgi:hypothetical protein